MTQAGAETPVHGPMPFVRHMAKTARLAVPVVATRAGLLIMLAVDTAMVGHYGTTDLAYFAAANALQVVLVLIGVGFLQATVIVVSQAHGAGLPRECGRYLSVGMLHGAIFGIAVGCLCLLGAPMLRLIGHEPDLAEGGGRVLDMIAWGFPGLMVWVACAFFLEGISRPLPSTIVMAGGLLLNVLLDWIFVFGSLGAPAMGAEGAALTTTVVRWVMLGAIVIYIYKMPDGALFGVHDRVESVRATSRRLRRIGYPLGAARGLEVGAFSALTMLAGFISTPALASYQIAYNLVGLVFMCAVGTGTATTIRVGNAVGGRNTADVIRAGWAGVAVIGIVMVCLAVPFLVASDALAHLYSDDTAVLPTAAAMIVIAGYFLLFDGAQAVLMGSLRGAADVWIPPAMQLVSWWCVAVPVGYVLAFEAGVGVEGLMWGIFAGAVVACVLLSVRFYLVSRRGVARY